MASPSSRERTWRLRAGKKASFICWTRPTWAGCRRPREPIHSSSFRRPSGCTANCAKHLSTAFWPRATNPRLYVWEVGDYLRTYPFDSAAQRFVPGSRDRRNAAALAAERPERQLQRECAQARESSGPPRPRRTRSVRLCRARSVPTTPTTSRRSFTIPTRTPAGTRWDRSSRFAPPIVANGKVYVNTQSNVLNVYGLLPSGNSNTVYVRLNTVTIRSGGRGRWLGVRGIQWSARKPAHDRNVFSTGRSCRYAVRMEQVE